MRWRTGAWVGNCLLIPLEPVRGGCYLLGINSYTAFIDSLMRNVNEGKSDDLGQSMVHPAGHNTCPRFDNIGFHMHRSKPL
jgi:hypothetical protein